jgi:putative protease
MRRPELLAPAGDWDALRAAVANGADAVYFGLNQFNARHRATNFTLAELPEVMNYLHGHNVKGFVTFNTLVFTDELPAAVEYLKNIARAGVDAVIVQDLGIASIIHQVAPSLAIHASTQMTLTEPWGIEFVREFGVERAVVARELSLKDIQKIAQGTTMPLEVFIHGALCVSYSGQCLTSESLGGRSANRGQCAQACRLPYELVVDGQVKELGDRAYLLSPSDLAAYDLIGELTAAGVASFKIEGRLKSAHYVAATTQTYRAAVDAAIERSEVRSEKSGGGAGGFVISESQRHDLEQTFSRGFTHGFLSGVNHQELVAARFPKARGTRIGTVVAKTGRGVVVEMEPRGHEGTKGKEGILKAGDGVVFDEGHPEQDEQGGRIFAVKPVGAGGPKQGGGGRGAQRIELEFRAGDVNLAYINAGAIVWKTDDPALKRRLEHSYARETVVHRVPVAFRVVARVGGVLEVIAEAEGRRAAARWEEKTIEAANKFPFSEATAREQLSRLGDTPFELGTLTLDTDGKAMVPKSVLNELRRRVVEELLRGRERKAEIVERDVLGEIRAQIAAPAADNGATAGDTPNLYVLVRTMEQLDAVLAHSGPMKPAMVYVEFEDVRRYPEAIARCRAAPGEGMPVALGTIRIVKPGEQGFLKQVSDCGPDALLVRSLAAMGYYREKAPGVPLIADYSLNIANELTAGIFAKAGVVRMVPSYDLNWTQLAGMVRRFDPAKFEAVIHQHMPMFHMEHCVFAHTLSDGKDFHDCGRPCERHQVDLRDRVGEAHPLIPDVGCRNTLYNAQAQTAAEYLPQMRELGLRHFRVELLRENAVETGRILDRYTRLLTGAEKPLETLRSLRVLNQLGVTRGTLVHE